jgi:ribonuclease HII
MMTPGVTKCAKYLIDVPAQWQNLSLLCGVDEAGRGPLAGPVYAAAVILDRDRPIDGLADSKKLTESERDRLAMEIKSRAKAWAIAFSSAEEIDRHNILRASLLAMRRAVLALNVTPELVVADGTHCPALDIPVAAIVKGDSKVAAISAASILAKTARDAVLIALHEKFPEYGFAGHKGYPTPQHLLALNRHGPCVEHRRSFAPVKALVAGLGPLVESMQRQISEIE